jgi:outer membrane protein insertion porin family
MLSWLWIWLWVSLAPVSRADAPLIADGTVSDVVVRGNRSIKDDVVQAAIGLRPGERLTADKVRRDLTAVFRTGFFDDVVVRLIESSDGVKVVFDVIEKPPVLDVRIEGNKKIDEEDLRELIDERDFDVLNEARVRETVALIRDKYVEKGFYLAEIDPVVEPVGDAGVAVVFNIVENRKVIVQRIEFTGNENVPDSRIKRFMQTKEGGFAPWLTSTGNFNEDLLAADSQTIQLVFWEEGYIEARIDPPKVYLSPDKRYIFISFHVEEGQRYDIAEIDAEGDFVEEEGLTKDAVMAIVGGRAVADVQEDQWRASRGKAPPVDAGAKRALALKSGDTFVYSTMGQVVQSVGQLYKDQGYAFANVIPQTTNRPDEGLVDIKLVIEKGEKMRIGRIRVSGNDPTFDKVVRREILVNEGEVYRGSLLDATRYRLQRLGFFEDVQIGTPRGEAADVLDLNVKVVEQPTGSFSLGMGYSNLERFAVNANISKNNFLGMGYTVSASVNWSALRRQASLNFFDPYFLDSRWTLKIDGFWIERKFQLNEFQRGATIGIGRYLDRRDDIQLRLEYTIEDVGITSLDAYRQRVLGGALFRNGLTSSVGLSLIVDRRNNRIFPTKGFFATAAVNLAGGFRTADDKVVSVLGGDFNFVEARLNFRLYQPLIPRSDLLVFRFNTTIGAIWSTDGQIIPFIHRFRAGGINSVRGFQWFSLGPSMRIMRSDDPSRGDDVLVVGGTQTWINNFEIESPIVKAAGISAVVFFDAGNTFGDPWGDGSINPLRLRAAAGLGIRWRSPIGPLRFELGFPLQPRADERKSVFDFSIGSFF